MSCTELGFDEDYGIRLTRSADFQLLIEFPDTYDLAGWSSTFKVRAELDDAAASLTVNSTAATANGSVIVLSENAILLTIKAADIDALPTATDPAEPWVGWFEWLMTDTDNLVARLFQLPFIVERGAAE